jgi:hypothetical protein
VIYCIAGIRWRACERGKTLGSAAVADAEQALVDGGSLAPGYLVVGRIGHGQLFYADNSTPERKTASMELVRLLTVAADAELILSLAEAWMVLGDYTPGLAPSRSDRDREVVAALAAARIDDTMAAGGAAMLLLISHLRRRSRSCGSAAAKRIFLSCPIR